MDRSNGVLGAVLAGGGSRRMGRDKALLELDGQSLVARAADALGRHLDEVVIVSARLGDHEHPRATEIADRFRGKGPLGGIHAALVHARGRPVLVLACDLPRVGPELVDYLLEEARQRLSGDSSPGVVAVAMDGRVQPLCAVYSPACLPPIERRIRRGELRTLDFASAVGLGRIQLGPKLPFYRNDLLLNVNAPAEARAAGAGPRPRPALGEAVRKSKIVEVADGQPRDRDDFVAVEEPLEIRVVAEGKGQRARHSVAITMRTPGHDFELAAGFLLSEGVVTGGDQVWRVAHCESPERPESEGNIVEVHLAPGVAFDPAKSSRNVYTTSSCGVCGRGSLELLWTAQPERPGGDLSLEGSVLLGLPDRLRAAQEAFGKTGGLHAAALCAPSGEIEQVREDVGRHNAVDKVIGHALLADRLPAAGRLLLVSGRASFELVQKAIMAGIPALAAVGAPSSLAISAAEDYGLTLVGFLDRRRFNVYAGRERLS
jgi:FdhD protein